MHWLLDVNFGEDGYKVRDEDVQKNLNVLRKIVINCINSYKACSNSKDPASQILFANLLDSRNILAILYADRLQN